MKADPTPTELTDRQAFLALNGLPGMGSVARNRLVEAFGHPRAVLEAPPEAVRAVEGVPPSALAVLRHWRRHFDPAREEARLAAAGADFVCRGERAYPERLGRIADPPLGLYRQGTYGLDRPAIAIVGTRRASAYGATVARSLAGELAALGYCVVSGLALGIDAAAHEGALAAGGPTVAVLGSGVDTPYPPENRGLHRRIAEAGAVVSEFALGRRPDLKAFPMRNRLVSGMCLATVVVESAERGGAMITAGFAGDQGRLLYAVPGRIDQPGSAGCHRLIRDGATLLTRVDDLLEDLRGLGGFEPGPVGERAARPGPRARADLTPDERAILACLAEGDALAADALAARTGRSAAAVAAALPMLEIRGLAVRRLDGAYEKDG